MSREWAAALTCTLVGPALLAACATGSVSEPPELAITVEATPDAGLVGDTIQVFFEAQGPELNAITLDYGDGKSETVGTSGARTATGSRLHVYTTAGAFEIVATAVSGADQIETARTTVQIAASGAVAWVRAATNRLDVDDTIPM